MNKSIEKIIKIATFRDNSEDWFSITMMMLLLIPIAVLLLAIFITVFPACYIVLLLAAIIFSLIDFITTGIKMKIYYKQNDMEGYERYKKYYEENKELLKFYLTLKFLTNPMSDEEYDNMYKDMMQKDQEWENCRKDTMRTSIK